MVGRGSNIRTRGSTISTRRMCVKLCMSGDRAHVVWQGLSTSSDVLNPRTRSLVMEGAQMLQKSPALQVLLEDQDVDLVLDVRHGSGATRTSYYCVSHAERCVFWLEGNGIGHGEVDTPCTSNKCTKSKGWRVHCAFISSDLSSLWLTISKVSRRNTGEPIRR
jgi:hypothetical protein